MTEVPQTYDIFISCHNSDYRWVKDELRPKLEADGFAVSSRFYEGVIGQAELVNIENLIAQSRTTIIVLSPSWMDDSLNQFEGLVSRSQDPAGAKRMVLPLVLAACPVPGWLAHFNTADFTDVANRDKEYRRLVRDLQNKVPPPPRETQGSRNWPWLQWWLRYYRGSLFRGLAGLLGLWLLAALVFQFFPFQRRAAWVAYPQSFPEGQVAGGSADVWLVGGANIGRVCGVEEMGIWRSEDGGQTWQSVQAPLDPDGQGGACVLADIQGFATAGERIYMATSDVGVLRSDDGGLSWNETAELPTSVRPDVVMVTVNPARPDVLYVTLRSGGLFGSQDGGDNWSRLDNQEDVDCPEGSTALDKPLVVGALLALPDYVVAATGELVEEDDMGAGIYWSVDGGRCWRITAEGLIDNAYRRLAAVDGERFLVYWRDWARNPDELPNRFGLVDLTAAETELLPFSSNRQSLADLAVVGETVYWVDTLGRTFRGEIMTGKFEPLPDVRRCLLPCDLDLWTADSSEPPLLLAGGRLRHLEQDAAWWQRYWP